MDVSYGISRYLDSLAHARTALRNPAVAVPFLAFALLQILVILAMASFITPWLAPVMVPVMRLLGGEASLHYPAHLVGLPAVYRRIYLPLAATIGFTLWCFGLWMLVDRRSTAASPARRTFARAIPRLVVIGFVFVGASVVPGEAATRLVGPKTPAMVARALLLLPVGVTALAQVFLVFAPAVLRLRGGSAWGAIRAGARHAQRTFIATALLVGTMLLVHLPVDFLLSKADRVAARLQPETIIDLMLLSATLEALTAYVLFAGVTELALAREDGLR